MADDLEPIRQVFESDLEPYIEPMREAEDEAKRFARDNQEAADEIRQLARAVRDNSDSIRELSRALREDDRELDELRDKSVEAGEALGHLRDEAAEAAHEVNDLGRQSKETAADLDLMGLSGASTLSHLGPLASLIGALVVAAAAAAPAFVAMGAGLGAFAVFALPTIKQVTGALKDNQSQLAKLPAPIREAVQQVHSLSSEWHSLSAQFQAPTLNIFSGALQIAARLLREIVPLAHAGATAFQHIESAIGQGLQSTGFANFLHLITSMVVPATDAIIHLGGALSHVLGQALTALAPMSVPFINFLTGIVKALSGPLSSALAVVVRLFMGLATAIAPLLPGLSHLATLLINDIGKGFQSFIPILTQIIQILGGSLIKILTDLEPIFANLLTPNSGFLMALGLIPGILRAILPLFETLASILAHPIFATIAADAITVVVAFKGLMAIMGLLRGAFIALTAVMEVNPIILIATAIAILVVAFITLWQHCAGFRDFWKGLWQDILSAAAPVINAIKAMIGALTAFWSSHWNTISAILKAVWTVMSGIVRVNMAIIEGVIKVAMAAISAAWKVTWEVIKAVVTTVFNVIKAIIQGTMQTIMGIIRAILAAIHGNWSAAWHDLVSVASAQMHMVASVISSIGRGFISLLYNAGRSIIQGLINGVESMVGAVVSIAQSIGSTISSAFGAVLHIFSPSQVFFEHGRNTLLGYIHGVLAMMPMAKSVMEQAAQMMVPPQVLPSQVYGGAGVSGGPPALAGVGAAAGAGPSGNLIVQVDGKTLFSISQSQLYQYNIRNSGHVTGVLKPT